MCVILRSRNSPAAAAAARVTRARVCKAAWRFAPAFERNCARSTSTACTSSSWCRRRGAAGGRGGALGGRRRLVERAPRLGRRRRGRERRVDALLSRRRRGQRAVRHVVDRDGVRAPRLVPAGGRGVQNRSRNTGAPDFRARSSLVGSSIRIIVCPRLCPGISGGFDGNGRSSRQNLPRSWNSIQCVELRSSTRI